MSFVNSPVHDLLIRIKNAYMARLNKVNGVMYSNFKKDLLELLKKYKFVKDYEILQDWNKRTIRVLLHDVVDPVNDIPSIKFYTRPSKRWYISSANIKWVAWGRWIWIISTSKWLMASHEAKKLNLWGELIAEIF